MGRLTCNERSAFSLSPDVIDFLTFCSFSKVYSLYAIIRYEIAGDVDKDPLPGFLRPGSLKILRISLNLLLVFLLLA